MTEGSEYEAFLASKRQSAVSCGFEKPKEEMCAALFPWQRDIVYWALKKGRCALFEDCGLGKTIQSLEWARSVSEHCGKPVLIVCPLAVTQQTRHEGEKFGFEVRVCRSQAEVREGVHVTNYEMLGHFDPAAFGGVVLDESSILKNYAGKIRNEIVEAFRDTPFKLSCTATPAPNDYMELGNQSEFLGVMSRTEMLATYFVHDGGDTSKWRLKGHAREAFWEWLASWAVVLTNPADLGYDGSDYILPPLRVLQHCVEARDYIIDENYSLFAGVAQTLSERREARRDSLRERCAMAAKLVAERPEEQWLVWCDLNAEADALRSLIPGAVEIRGSDGADEKADALCRFALREIPYLITKPGIAAWGVNWQNCRNMIFVGLSDSFEMYYQAVRRCWRFGQEKPVEVHIVTSEAEGEVKENVERKEKQAAEMTAEMVKRTRKILEQEIRGTVKISIPYNPQAEMVIPEWLKGKAA